MQLTNQISWQVLASLCLLISGAVLANIISFVMIRKINVRLPEDQRVSCLWWGSEVRKTFKRLYPGDRLVLLLDGCVVMMIVCFVCLVKFWVFAQ
jgi:hypothetical protein